MNMLDDHEDAKKISIILVEPFYAYPLILTSVLQSLEGGKIIWDSSDSTRLNEIRQSTRLIDNYFFIAQVNVANHLIN